MDTRLRRRKGKYSAGSERAREAIKLSDALNPSEYLSHPGAIWTNAIAGKLRLLRNTRRLLHLGNASAIALPLEELEVHQHALIYSTKPG